MERGRRKKVRYIQKMPSISQFSPRGKPGRPDEIELKVDEFEAIKLADYQGFDQSEGAKVMGLSRASFGRILRHGRKIIADALVNGKIIRIRIGNVQVGVRQKNLPAKRHIKERAVGSLEAKQEEVVRDAILNYVAKPEAKSAKALAD
jgi:predicted DNA-binding protein (UPF0251 family)